MNPNPEHKHISEFEGLDFVNKTAGFAVLIETVGRTVIYVNQFFCDLFKIKIPPHKLIGSTVSNNARGFSMQFTKAEAFEKSLLSIPENLAVIKNEEWQLRNGSILLRDYSPQYNNNHLQGHIWIYREKKVQNSSLKNNPNSLVTEQTLNQLSGAIAVFNSKSEFVFANKNYITASEKRAWAKGKTLQQYFSYANLPLQTAQLREKYLQQCLNQKQPISWEEEMLSNNSSPQYFSRTFYPNINIDGVVETVVEQAINITKQKKLTEQLKESEEHLHNVLNKVNDVVIKTDANLKLNFFNKAFENITGQNLHANSGKPIFDVLPVQHYNLYQKIFTVLEGTESSLQGKLNLVDKLGKEKKLQYNLQPNFSVENGKQGILAIFNDITQQELQEQQLLELIKKEKELNELKTAFVNMVSHELRTPLTVISSSAEILDLMLDAGHDKEQIKTYTKQIIEQVEKMTSFMQDLLMISKIEAGKVELNPNNTNIETLVAEVLKESFNPWKDGRQATIATKRKSNPALIDAKMIKHVLQNLLQNAFKYSEGKIAPAIRIAFAKSYFTISIADNGIGIPTAELQNLFTSFFRASNTGNISGTGIGLMVAKYFTEQHKGYVAVKTKQNAGTVFTVKLPYS